MKICITASGRDMDSAFNPRFGRCDYFLFVDTESDKIEAVKNDQTAADGAGVKAAASVGAGKPDCVLSGNIGPNAFSALNAAGIQVYLGSADTVKNAIKAYQDGKFTKAGAPTNSGHPGM